MNSLSVLNRVFFMKSVSFLKMHDNMSVSSLHLKKEQFHCCNERSTYPTSARPGTKVCRLKHHGVCLALCLYGIFRLLV